MANTVLYSRLFNTPLINFGMFIGKPPALAQIGLSSFRIPT
jgi:hypothetical protein